MLANLFSPSNIHDPAAYRQQLLMNDRIQQQIQQAQAEEQRRQYEFARKKAAFQDIESQITGMQQPPTMQQGPDIQLPAIGGMPVPTQVTPPPQMQPPKLPAPRTAEGFEFRQGLNDKVASNYFKILEHARQTNNQNLADNVSKWFTNLGPQYAAVGDLITQMDLSNTKEKKYIGQELMRLPEEKRSELGFTGDVKVGPMDVVSFKKDPEGNWAIDKIDEYKNIAGAGVKYKTYEDNGYNITVRINPDNTVEEVGRSPIGYGKQRFVEDKVAGTMFDTWSGTVHKAVAGPDGKVSYPTLSTEEKQELATQGASSQEQGKAAGKVVGEQAIAAEKDLPAMRKTRIKLLDLKKLAMEDWKDAFGKISQLQAALGKISPNWEKRFANATERNRLKAEALKLVPEDVKKMFGPPFSDSDMRVMFEFTGVDLSSQQTFLQALRNSISSTENEIDKLERMQQIAAPGVPGAKKKEQQVKEQQTFENNEKLKNIQERELKAASIAAAREGKTKFTYNGVKYIIVKQGKNYTVMPER